MRSGGAAKSASTCWMEALAPSAVSSASRSARLFPDALPECTFRGCLCSSSAFAFVCEKKEQAGAWARDSACAAQPCA